jgi:hypothetical protein
MIRQNNEEKQKSKLSSNRNLTNRMVVFVELVNNRIGMKCLVAY